MNLLSSEEVVSLCESLLCGQRDTRQAHIIIHLLKYFIYQLLISPLLNITLNLSDKRSGFTICILQNVHHSLQPITCPKIPIALPLEVWLLVVEHLCHGELSETLIEFLKILMSYLIATTQDIRLLLAFRLS